MRQIGTIRWYAEVPPAYQPILRILRICDVPEFTLSTFSRWMHHRLGLPMTSTHDVRGLRVVVENTRPDIATADVLARLDEALALVEAHQPWRLRHLRRDLRQIRVARFACRGAYFPEERTCLTELTFLARRDITAAPVAASIVHEGMHARAHLMTARLGGAHDPARLPREERVCRRAELDFGLALPPALGAPVIERALATLAMGDQEVAPSVDWAEAARRVDAVDRGAR